MIRVDHSVMRLSRTVLGPARGQSAPAAGKPVSLSEELPYGKPSRAQKAQPSMAAVSRYRRAVLSSMVSTNRLFLLPRDTRRSSSR